MIASLSLSSEQSCSTSLRDSPHPDSGRRAEFSRKGDAGHCPNYRRLRCFARAWTIAASPMAIFVGVARRGKFDFGAADAGENFA
jgi:hypothetical protein